MEDDRSCYTKKRQPPVFKRHSSWILRNIMDTEVDFEWAVSLNRVALDSIGLWPKAAENYRHKLLCNLRVLVVFLGIILVVTIPCLRSLEKIQGDVMLLIDNLQCTLATISCLIRIAIFWWKKEAIIPILDMIAEDWLKSRSAQEKNVMIGRAQVARIIITCAYCIMGFGCFFAVGLPAIGVSLRKASNTTHPSRPLPLEAHIISDIASSPQYELTFVGRTISLFFIVMTYTGIDNFLGLLVCHICGQLDILNDRLASLDQRVHFHNAVKCCVLRHMRLLSAIDVIEDTYNMILLALFAYFGILFALYGFRIISMLDEGTDTTLFHLIYLISNIFNIFGHMCLYCALGDILEAQCNGIYYAAYCNNWYSVDPKLAKDLLPLLVRGTRPICLTAGKIFPITMATFCSLIKTSAGYISVLHTMRNS